METEEAAPEEESVPGQIFLSHTSLDYPHDDPVNHRGGVASVVRGQGTPGVPGHQGAQVGGPVAAAPLRRYYLYTSSDHLAWSPWL